MSSNASQSTPDINSIATDLELKLDLDCTNVTKKCINYMTQLGFPAGSDATEDLTLGSSGAKYRIAAPGYLCFSKMATAAGQYIQIINNANGAVLQVTSRASERLTVLMPYQSQQELLVAYNAGGATQEFRVVHPTGTAIANRLPDAQ